MTLAFIVIPTLDPEVAEKTGNDAISVAGIEDVELCIVHDTERTGATKQLNIGFKKGIETTDTQYICYLNDDSSKYPKGWLARMIEALEEDASYMIAVSAGPCRGGVQRKCLPGTPKGVTVISRGAWFCVVIKRQAFEELGYMDEQFAHYAQDGDFSFRASQNGYKTICVKDVYVHHEVNKPVFPWWRDDSRKLRAKWNMKRKGK